MDNHVTFKMPSSGSRLPAPCLMDTLSVGVVFDEPAKALIGQQLELDINAKGLGWRPVPFTLFHLLELETLLKRQPQNGGSFVVVFTHPERKILASYVAHYYLKARDNEDFDRWGAYNRLLACLLELSTWLPTSL